LHGTLYTIPPRKSNQYLVIIKHSYCQEGKLKKNIVSNFLINRFKTKLLTVLNSEKYLGVISMSKLSKTDNDSILGYCAVQTRKTTDVSEFRAAAIRAMTDMMVAAV
jgi:hypothetical protein